jgi:hypothetical protein
VTKQVGDLLDVHADIMDPTAFARRTPADAHKHPK